MQGLELSHLYYEEFGKGMIAELFPEYENRIAVGLAGAGSDCFGFDDEISLDHDLGAGFCLWLTDEDMEKIGFRLSRAYAKLPNEFMGFKKGRSSAYASERYGVKSIGDFYLPLTGCNGAPQTVQEWLNIPEHFLACAVNGEVFRDDLGTFSAIRQQLCEMPEDIRLKKLAAHCINAAQSGQYNFSRCINHGENAAAMLAAARFVESYASAVYLLNGRYSPFYKWMLKGLSNLEIFGDTARELSFVMLGANDENGLSEKEKTIENLCKRLAEHLQMLGLSNAKGTFLEPHAYSIANRIKDPYIRNLHIMEGA